MEVVELKPNITPKLSAADSLRELADELDSMEDEYTTITVKVTGEENSVYFSNCGSVESALYDAVQMSNYFSGAMT